jgi:hypothetical protein
LFLCDVTGGVPHNGASPMLVFCGQLPFDEPSSRIFVTGLGFQ